MPIPDTGYFNDCLSSLTVTTPAPQDDFDCLEVVPARFLSDGSGILRSDSIRLWHRRSCPLTATRMTEILCKELKHSRHVSKPEMGRAVLAILCLGSSAYRTPVTRLNKLLERIGSAEA